MEGEARVFSREITKVQRAGGLLRGISMGRDESSVSKVRMSGKEDGIAQLLQLLV